MAKTKASPRRKRVSPELADVLNRIAGELPARRRAEARKLLAGTSFWEFFIRCTWWGGCYYCQDLDGRWYVVKCYA